MKASKYSVITYVKRLYRSFLNSYLQHEYYLSIEDLPIYNWNKINEGQVEYLIRRKRFIQGRPDLIWPKIMDEFFAKFGLSKDLKKHLDKIRKLTILICENGLKFDSAKQVRITMMEAELQNFEKKTTAVDFYQNVATLSTFVKYGINPKKTTVIEYFTMLEQMKKAVHKNNDGKTERGNRGRRIPANDRRSQGADRSAQ